MAEEQVKEESTFVPSDDSAMAWMQGSDQKAEQSGAQAPATPATPEKAPEPMAPTASPDIAAQIKELLKSELNPLQSELGQLRKVRSEFEKFKAAQNQPQTPTSLDKMSPEERQQVKELVKFAFMEEFGSDWNRVTQFSQKSEQMEMVNAVEQTAREIAGDQFKELDPIMGRLHSELVAKAEAGDRQAQRLVYEIANTYSGVAHLVSLAKQELSQTVQATEQKATQQRQAQAKKAGTALTAAPTDPKAGEDVLKQFKNLSQAEMRKKLMEAGAL